MSEVRRLTKNEKRRQKKKEIEVQNGGNGLGSGELKNGSKGTVGKLKMENGTFIKDEIDHDILEVQVEYVSADMEGEFDFNDDRQVLDQFKSIFEKFAKPEELLAVALASAIAAEESSEGKEGDNDKEEDLEEENKISKKKKKLMSRLSVAELKQLVQRPDVVEAHDVTSSDPRLLVFLKAYRNTVPVPRHWCHKRKYLQGSIITINKLTHSYVLIRVQ
jgi:splicing factor 3B subunit 2